MAKNHNTTVPENQTEELEHVGESALFELAQVAGATFTTAELYHLAELILGQAYERERRAGVL